MHFIKNLCVYHIKRQMDAQAKDFEDNGGFTERLYRVRQQKRRQS
ncbi:MAG: four helix bundle suffix domain-containing protein [Kiritimatiellia bacterium]